MNSEAGSAVSMQIYRLKLITELWFSPRKYCEGLNASWTKKAGREVFLILSQVDIHFVANLCLETLPGVFFNPHFLWSRGFYFDDQLCNF